MVNTRFKYRVSTLTHLPQSELNNYITICGFQNYLLFVSSVNKYLRIFPKNKPQT